jgi:hypothetical protein
MDAQGFHHGLAAQLDFQAEKIFEGAVGEINFAVAVKEQQTFEHGIEENLLLRLRVNGRLLLTTLKIFEIRAGLPLLAQKILPPPEMQDYQRAECKND